MANGEDPQNLAAEIAALAFWRLRELELQRPFTGHAEAGGRDTVEGYRRELIDKGFIAKTRGHHLGASGIGQAALWALTEYTVEGAKATMDFKRWQN